MRESLLQISANEYVQLDMSTFFSKILLLEILSSKQLNLIFFFSIAEYKILCPGGEGFRPNPITVILEGNSVSFIRKSIRAELPWVY